jgi:hypothetical protein
LVDTNFNKSINRTTNSKILKNKDMIKEKSNTRSSENRRIKSFSFNEVDVLLFDWLVENEKTLPISEAVLIEQAKFFARGLKFSEIELDKINRNWIAAFKRRHGVKKRKMHGEAGSVNDSCIDTALPVLKSKIDCYDYCDVFNFDETGLFYRLEPTSTLASKPISGRKKDLERITIGLCKNVLGTEKLRPIVIENI